MNYRIPPLAATTNLATIHWRDWFSCIATKEACEDVKWLHAWQSTNINITLRKEHSCLRHSGSLQSAILLYFAGATSWCAIRSIQKGDSAQMYCVSEKLKIVYCIPRSLRLVCDHQLHRSWIMYFQQRRIYAYICRIHFRSPSSSTYNCTLLRRFPHR